MNKNVFICYLVGLVFFLILCFEVIERGDYLFALLLLSILVGSILIVSKINFGSILIALGLSILTSWIIVVIVGQYQSYKIYDVISSIEKQQLLKYLESEDISYLPVDKRNMWVGLRWQEIKIIKENRIEKIKAVGWKGNLVFGYYDFTNKRYFTSIK